jgi:hypothetical protein
VSILRGNAVENISTCAASTEPNIPELCTLTSYVKSRKEGSGADDLESPKFVPT